MVRTFSIFCRTGRCSWRRAPSQGYMLNSWGEMGGGVRPRIPQQAPHLSTGVFTSQSYSHKRVPPGGALSAGVTGWVICLGGFMGPQQGLYPPPCCPST